MNKQIRLLAEQAGIHDDVCSMCPIHELDKFAQLIVAECAVQVDHILRERQAGGGTMGDEIREHFGVKQ
jgi:hypothetical protein